jgi:NADH dehydrogenase [ubiquinone] 1 alpha subcomplex assembly factor 5
MLLLRLTRRCSPQNHARSYAAISASSPSTNTVGPYQVFDRRAKMIQRDRAALRDHGKRSRTVDYVRDEVAERMLERFLVRSI